MQALTDAILTPPREAANTISRMPALPEDTATAAAMDSAALPAAAAAGAPPERTATQTAEAMARSLDLIRRAAHPLDMYPTPDLLTHLGEPLDKVMAVCWQAQGTRLRHRPGPTTESGNAAKVQAMHADVFFAALRLLPICPPPEWLANDGRAQPSLPVFSAAPVPVGVRRCLLLGFRLCL